MKAQWPDNCKIEILWKNQILWYLVAFAYEAAQQHKQFYPLYKFNQLILIATCF